MIYRRQIERNKLAREKQLREAAEREKAAMEQRLMQYQEEIRLANEALVSIFNLMVCLFNISDGIFGHTYFVISNQIRHKRSI